MVNKKKVPIEERFIRVALAVGFAIVLWIMVNGNSQVLVTEDYNSVPITLTNAETLKEKKLVLVEDKNYYLNLQVRGTDRSLKNVKIKEVTAEVDLSEIDARGIYNLDVEVKGLSNTVIVSAMKPSSLQLEVESIIKEEMEVGVVIEGRPADNLSVISAKAIEKVDVEGPKEAIARISEITVTVNVNGLKEDTTQNLKVNAYDEGGNAIRDLSPLPGVVNTEIILGKTKTVPVIPLTTGEPAHGFIVTDTALEPDTVVIGAKEELLNSISFVSMEAVDVSGQSRTFTKVAELKAPEGAYFIDGNDKNKVTVSIESPVEKSYTIDKVTPRNLRSGLSVSKIKDTRVVVKVEGANSEVNNIIASQIEAYVDCSNLGPGEHEVPIYTNLTAPQTRTITPNKTTVTIE